MNEAEAYEFYADPDHLTASGPGQRRRRPMKSGMIPVRFSPDMIAAVKRFASQDGVTVSTWIRPPPGLEGAPASAASSHGRSRQGAIG